MIRILTAILILGGGLWYLLQFGIFYPEEFEDPFEKGGTAKGGLVCPQKNFEKAIPDPCHDISSRSRLRAGQQAGLESCV